MSATTYANNTISSVGMTSTSGKYVTDCKPTGTYKSKMPTVFTPADWHTSNSILSSTAVRQQGGSSDVRQASRKLRNETDSNTEWNQHYNTTKLFDRAHEIQTWKDRLQHTMAETEEEMANLARHKERCKVALQNMDKPTEVTRENMATRDLRVSIDVVDDEVNRELKNEAKIIASIKDKLNHKINEAEFQTNALNAAFVLMREDLTDKMQSLDIDQQSCEMSNQSGNIGFYNQCTRIPDGTVSPKIWDNNSTYNVQRAIVEMKGSTALREAINSTIEQTANDLEAQRLKTEFAFRKRIHELDQCLDEIEWQKRNTEREINVLSEDIRGLQQSIDDKNKPLQVAETRSENRTYRPRVELCRDAPQDGLKAERHELLSIIRALNHQLETAEDALEQLKQTLSRLDEDWAVKNNSRDLEKKCMSKRAELRLKAHKV